MRHPAGRLYRDMYQWWLGRQEKQSQRDVDDKWQSEYWSRTGSLRLTRPPIKSQWDPVTTARYFMWTNRGSGVHGTWDLLLSTPSLLPPMVTLHMAKPASPQLILLSEDGLNAEHHRKHRMSRLKRLSCCAVTGRAMSYFHWSETWPGILVEPPPPLLLIKTWAVFDNCHQQSQQSHGTVTVRMLHMSPIMSLIRQHQTRPDEPWKYSPGSSRLGSVINTQGRGRKSNYSGPQNRHFSRSQ